MLRTLAIRMTSQIATRFRLRRQEVSYPVILQSCLYKTTSKKFEFWHKSYATAVAMAAMTFQDGGYFCFKVI